MEFGLFLQGYVPGAGAPTTPTPSTPRSCEEAELVELADKTGWKYAWFSEHHALTEYSHISSSEVMMGYLFRATERIHLGSGIFNLSPRVNHPVRNAERVTMLDHLSSGRFELGTGRGAGSHEVATFNIHDTSSTKSEWDEVIWELRKMWETEDYTFQGKHFQLDTPHNILPKPYKGVHPPMWVACGNPPTFEKAGKMGIGALGFNFSPIHDMKPMIDSYKKGIANCTEPVGRYINDNIMLTNAVLCFEDGNKARDLAAQPDRGYLYTLVCLYHDTFPKPDWAPVWPEPPIKLDREGVERVINMGGLLCGTPDEVCEQLKAYEQTGVDQVSFGFPSHLSHDDAMECIELFGTKVIPEFDKDPVHRTTHYRNTAR